MFVIFVQSTIPLIEKLFVYLHKLAILLYIIRQGNTNSFHVTFSLELEKLVQVIEKPNALILLQLERD